MWMWMFIKIPGLFALNFSIFFSKQDEKELPEERCDWRLGKRYTLVPDTMYDRIKGYEK